MKISEIKAMNEAAGRFFFSRETLKHFGERLWDHTVWTVYTVGNTPLYYIYNKKTGKLALMDNSDHSIMWCNYDWNITCKADLMRYLKRRRPFLFTNCPFKAPKAP